MTPISITFCITELDPGGAERALVQIVTRLDRSEWSPTVICLAGHGEMADPLEAAGIPVYCLGARRSRDVGVLPRLVRMIRKCRPQVLQTFLFHANILGRIAGCWSGVPHIVSGLRVAEKRSRWPLRIDRWTQRCVEMNVCVSQSVAEFSQASGIPASKLIVIPNGVETERFQRAAPADLAAFGVPAGIRPLICIGRLDEQKGHRYLLEAMANLVPSDASLHLLVVGRGPQEQALKQYLAERGLAGHVHFAGWSDHVPELLKASSMLVLPSLWEGMPNVILEGMASGLPLIATDVEGVRELITSDVTGIIVPPANAAALATAIERLHENPQFARSLQELSQAIVAENFTWDGAAKRYAALYRRLLQNQAN